MPAASVADGGQHLVYGDGECEIDLGRRELRVLGSPVMVGGRAFEVIEVLARSAGELVTKDELMNRIWPGAIVLENTLQVHTVAVRKALGPYRGLLKTESRRGYRLLGTWTIRHYDAAKPPVGLQQIRVSGESPDTNFPAPVTRLVGRAAAMQRLRDLISAYGLVTLTGPGGIGKSTLALKVARRVLADFENGGWLVELASLSDPDLVPSAVAGVLGVKLGGGDISAEAVARAVGGSNLLVVLDNCEHVIDAVANLVDAFVRFCPRTTILTTSREVLRTNGEYVYRVPPLEVPAAVEQAPERILGHSAVELFIARVTAQDSTFSPRAEIIPAIGAICRHLDGIPLAIEFAAARAATLGVQQVAAGLRDRFTLLTRGRRTAIPRHRTLRATLDWSYELLPDAEQLLLRHLAVFQGGFTIDAVAAVMNQRAGATLSVVNGIVELVTKSLVTLDGSKPGGRWRLLETIRAYALQKLADSGEIDAAQRRHAEYFRDLFTPLVDALNFSDEDIVRYGQEIDNARAALDWAFLPGGDPEIGVSLTHAAVPLWMQLSLMEECRECVERALITLRGLPRPNPHQQMRLDTALAVSLAFTKGVVPEVVAACTRALETAEIVDAPEFQLRSLYRIWSHSVFVGEIQRALAMAERFRTLAVQRSDISDQLVGERIYAVSMHYIGDQTTARSHIDRMLSRDTTPAQQARDRMRFQRDQGLSARVYLARILWLQGFADQAMQVVRTCVDDALAAGHALTLCPTLAETACPTALEVGDLAVAADYIKLLVDHAASHALVYWSGWGRCFEAELVARRGDATAALQLLRTSYADLGDAPIALRFIPIQGLLALACSRAGQIADGLAHIEDALEGCERSEERLGIAELLRIKGELVLQQGGAEAAVAAEDCFRQSLEWARRQGALAWELRSSLSFARLRMAQGRPVDARQIVAPVYNQFTEGFATADMLAAKQLLETLSTADPD